jgi:Tfp pilus assembly protein PilV
MVCPETQSYDLVCDRLNFLRLQVAPDYRFLQRDPSSGTQIGHFVREFNRRSESAPWRTGCSIRRMRRAPIKSAGAACGCSLIEALVAMALVLVAAGGLAQLAAFATRTNRQAARAGLATIVAQQKIEELVSDPALPLNLSPAGTLTGRVAGWFDFVDRNGRPLGAGASPPVGSAYLRRWSVAAAVDGDALIVEVAVADVRTAAAAGAEQVRLLTATRRRAL